MIRPSHPQLTRTTANKTRHKMMFYQIKAEKDEKRAVETPTFDCCKSLSVFSTISDIWSDKWRWVTPEKENNPIILRITSERYMCTFSQVACTFVKALVKWWRAKHTRWKDNNKQDKTPTKQETMPGTRCILWICAYMRTERIKAISGVGPAIYKPVSQSCIIHTPLLRWQHFEKSG